MNACAARCGLSVLIARLSSLSAHRLKALIGRGGRVIPIGCVGMVQQQDCRVFSRVVQDGVPARPLPWGDAGAGITQRMEEAQRPRLRVVMLDAVWTTGHNTSSLMRADVCLVQCPSVVQLPGPILLRTAWSVPHGEMDESEAWSQSIGIGMQVPWDQIVHCPIDPDGLAALRQRFAWRFRTAARLFWIVMNLAFSKFTAMPLPIVQELSHAALAMPRW